MESKGGLLLKRKDYLGVDEEAGSHPNRTYYFKKNTDDLNKIVLTCTKTLHSEPYNKESLLLRGSTYLKMERYKEAIEDFTDLLCLDCNSLETYYKRGVAYSKLESHDAAIVDFTKVLERNPDHVNASFARAACYNTIGHFSKAIEDYNTALLKDQSIVTATNSRSNTPNSKVLSPHYGSVEDRYLESNGKRLGMRSSSIDFSSTPNARSPAALMSTSGGSAAMRAGNTKHSENSLPSPPMPRLRLESEDDNSTVISGITFMSNAKGCIDSPGDSSMSYSHLPLSSDEYHQKGYELRRQGKFESAIEEYSKAIQKNPHHFKALFNRAFAMDKLGEHEEAIKDYTRALEVDPKNAYAYYNRGISHDRLENYFEASLDFKQAIYLSPTNIDFLHNLALCLRKMGQTKESLDAYTKCLKMDPNHVKARHGRAMCNEMLKQYDKALQDYDIILSQNPHHMICMVSRAHLLHKMSSHNETGTNCVLQYAGSEQQHHASTYYSDEALASFTQSLEILCPDVQCLINSISNQSSNVSSAGSVSSQANGNINRCTESISIFYARAKILEDRGDNVAAIHDLTSAICLASALVTVQDNNFLIPKSSTSTTSMEMQDHPCLSLYLLFYNRALGWKACDQYNNAITDLSTAIKLLNDERHTLQLQSGDSQSHERLNVLSNALNNAFNHRGFCFRKMENFEGAIDDYTRAIDVVPNNARALNNRAYCFAKKEMYAQAVADYTAVIEIDPLNSHSYHNRGISLDKLGKSDEALSDFSKVIELDSSIKPSSESEKIDISHSFRERYAHQDFVPSPRSPSLTRHAHKNRDGNHQSITPTSSPGPSSKNSVSTSRSGSDNTSQTHKATSLSTLGDNETNSKVRKPRRPPPSRPKVGPPPGHDNPIRNQRQYSTPSMQSHEKTLQIEENTVHISSPDSRSKTRGTAGSATHASAHNHRGTGTDKPSPMVTDHSHRSFEPIRLSSRGSASKASKKIAPRNESYVENSYNRRSFI